MYCLVRKNSLCKLVRICNVSPLNNWSQEKLEESWRRIFEIILIMVFRHTNCIWYNQSFFWILIWFYSEKPFRFWSFLWISRSCKVSSCSWVCWPESFVQPNPSKFSEISYWCKLFKFYKRISRFLVLNCIHYPEIPKFRNLASIAKTAGDLIQIRWSWFKFLDWSQWC